MTKLLSGRVKKVKSANVRASRYDFIGLSETEPDLGLPTGNNYVLLANTDGTRYWSSVANVSIATLSLDAFSTANLKEGSNLYYTNSRAVSAVTNSTLSNLTVSGNIVVGNVISAGGIGGSIIGANLLQTQYLEATQATVSGNIIAGNVISAGGVGGSIVGANLIQTNYIVATQATVSGNIIAGNVISAGGVGGSIIGANLIQTQYLEATQATISGNIIAGNVISAGGVGGSIVGANLIQTNYIQANVWQDIYTANVVEYPASNNLYYTNSRVYSNVIQILNSLNLGSQLTTDKVNETSNLYYTNARVISAVTNTSLSNLNVNGNINAGNLAVFGYIVAYTVSPNLVNTNFLETNSLTINGLTASQTFLTNVLNANTVIANVWQGIYTANVIESGSNLYFTNNRAVIAVTNSTLSNLTVSGNIVVGNVISAGGVGGSIVGANLLQTNYISANIWQGIYTANVIETASNLYFTNTRVYDNVIQILNSLNLGGQLTTDKVNETSNLYYTNARVISAVTGTSLSNLTVSGNIVVGNVISAGGVGGSIIGANLVQTTYLQANTGTFSGNIIAGNVISAGGVGGSIVGANLIQTNYLEATQATISGNIIAGNVISAGGVGGSIVGANLIQTNYIQANVWQGIYTSNIIESGNTDSGNVFFSNARARNAISAGDGTIIYDPIAGTIKATANVTATVTTTIAGLTTANIAESASSGNLYYTNSRVYSNVIDILSSLGLSAGNNFNTDQVVEAAGTSNLYYSNARGRTAVSGGTGISYSNVTGIISIGQNVATTANVQFNGLRVDGNASFYGTATFYGNVTTHTSNNLSVSDNMIYLNSGSESSNPDLGFAGNYNDGTYHHAGFFRDHSDGAWKVFENYTPEPDANIFINTAHASFRLANLTANIITASGYFVGNGAGLTNVIVNTVNGNLNVINGNVIATAFYGDGSKLTGIVTSINSVNGNLNVTGNVIANSYLIANGIIINGTEFVSNTSTGFVVAASNVNVSNVNTNVIKSNVWQGIYTANVIESASNLYYTNARVYANVIPLLSAKANVVDLTTANVLESASNLYYTNARVVAAVANTTISNITISGNANIFGNVIAPYFIGSGLYLTGISVNNVNGNIAVTGNVIANATLIANAAIINGNINASNINVSRIASNIWSGLYTGNIIESTGNLFYTNTRVASNIIQLLPTLAGQNITIEANGQIRANITSAIQGNLTITGNIIANGLIINGTEIVTGGTNAVTIRAANLTANIVTANVLLANSITVISNAIIGGNVVSNTYLIANGLIINGTEIVTGGTNEVTIRAANLTANIVTANVWQGIYTANVIESGSNLYFTNTRVISALSAGSGINLYANGLIEGGVLSLSDSQYFTSGSFIYAGGKTNVSMSASVSDSRRIIVSIDGLVQTPTLDYYVNGTSLAFTSNVSLNSVIEVKYFGNEAITALSFNPFLFASL